MKRFMVCFSGLKPGWVGQPETYTITVMGANREEALSKLSEKYNIAKIKNVRELKAKE